MEIREARCTNCGAQLSIEQGTPISRCEYCQSELIVEDAIAFSKVQIDHTEAIQNYRQGLADAIRLESYQEILRLSTEILDILPNDAYAEYFFAYGKSRLNEPSFLRRFYQKRFVLTHAVKEAIVDHIMRYGSLQDHTRIQAFIEAHAPERLDAYTESYHEKVLKEDQYAPVPRDVFICFSSYQKEDAQFVNGALKRDGYSTWISLDNLRPNDNENYWKNIEEAIQLCRIVIVLASEQAMVSPDVQKEVQLALKYKKPLIELKLDTAPHTTLFKHAFDGNKWIDASAGVAAQIGVLKQRLFDLDKSLKSTTPSLNITVPKSKKRLRLSLALITVVVIAVGSLLAFNPFSETNPVDPPTNTTPEDPIIDEPDEEQNLNNSSDEESTDNIFEIAFKGLDNSTIETLIVSSGETIIPPTPPMLEGYVFIGWNNDFENVTMDTDVQAIYHSIPTIEGPDEIYIDLNNDYNLLENFIITDFNDENIAEKVSITNDGLINRPGEIFITISVENAQGESASQNVLVKAYENPPQIEGADTAYIAVNTTFNPLDQVKATDSIDGDITDLIVIEGTLNSQVSGTYELTYSVTNRAGLITEITRIVYVNELVDGLNKIESSSGRFEFYIEPDVTLSVNKFNDITESVLDFPIPEKAGYIFEGWTLNGRVLSPDDELTDTSYQLQASWLDDNFGYAIFNGNPFPMNTTLTSEDYFGNMELGSLRDSSYSPLLPDTENRYAYIFTIDLDIREFEIPQFIHNRYTNGFYLRHDRFPLSGPEVGVKYYDSLRSVTIPKTFDGPVIVMAFNMYEINIHPDNQSYSVEDNILYSKDGRILYLYPQNITADEYIIPDSVEIIVSQAFYHVQNLRRITTTTDSELSILQRFSFFHMWDLIEITLPSRVEVLVDDAFIFSEEEINVIYND